MPRTAGSHYDCNLPTRGQATRLFSEAGFRHEEATIAAMRVLRELETMSVATRMLCSAPEPVLRALLPLNPTMIFLLRRGRLGLSGRASASSGRRGRCRTGSCPSRG